MKYLSAIAAFLLLALPALASARSVSFEVRDANPGEVAAIRLTLARAAKIAALEDYSAIVSDVKSIALFSSRTVPLSIAARDSVGRVEIRVSFTSPENSSVSATEAFQQFEAIDAFLSAELSARFAERFTRKVAVINGPNHSPDPTPAAVTPAADARVAPAVGRVSS